MSLEAVARQVDALPPRPGRAPVGQVPGEHDRVLYELRRKAEEAGLRLHVRGERYWLLAEDESLDIGEVAAVLG